MICLKGHQLLAMVPRIASPPLAPRASPKGADPHSPTAVQPRRAPSMNRFGYTFLWVDDVEAAVTFYGQAFGFSRRVLLENGPMGLYAELDTGQTTLAIAEHRE